ncbi:hypothetical protein [Alloactinosynnema sp. L-07]|nr:hypothetical protein [Alloactinosynnema sp. L-07]
MAALLPFDVTFQTLASYELGNRHCTVMRLLDLCDSLEVSASEVVGVVSCHAGDCPAPTGIVVSCAVLARTTRPALHPLRRWAKTMVTRDPSRDRVVLSDAAVVIAAELCGLSPATMDAHLRTCLKYSTR